jgi:HSP20 family protein
MFELAPFRRRYDRSLLQPQQDRDFSSLFQSFFDDFAPSIFQTGLKNFDPKVNISETETDLIITAEVPGMSSDELKVDISGARLTLRGEKRTENEESGTHYHRIERSYGTFSRSFTLPSYVRSEEINASYKDGVLTLTLPKEEKALPKTIPIKVSDE